MTPHADNAFSPLVEVLQDELQSVGIIPPAGSDTTSSQGFALWFLETIQLLERHVASSDAHPPMTRKEVELMCRCSLSAATLGETFALLGAFTDRFQKYTRYRDTSHQ